MSRPPPAGGPFYRPAQVARMLHCSEWWVKEQARKRRIPYTWIGGSYLFTDEHIAEIVRRFEVRPTDTSPSIPAPRRPADKSSVAQEEESGTRLTARPPRRTRATAPDTSTP